MTSQDLSEVSELDLSNMRLTDEELIVKLRAVAASSVVELNLTHVRLDKVPPALLAKIVSRLTKLNLSHSYPTKQQCVALLEACIPPTTMTQDLERYQTMRGLPVDLLLRGFGNLPQITCINLSGCSNLKEVPVDLLVKGLGNLTHINLIYTRLTRQQCVGVVDMCATSRLLVELSLSWADLANVSPQALGQAVGRLSKIDLTRCWLTGDQLIKILDACNTSTTLKHVNISGNRNLQQVPTEQLAKAVGNLDTVNLGYTNLTTEQCISVLEKCKSSKLTNIDLSGDDLRQVTPELLEEAIRNVQRMSLMWAKVTDEQRIRILNTVLTSRTTVHVSFRDDEKASLPKGLLIRAKETGRLK